MAGAMGVGATGVGLVCSLLLLFLLLLHSSFALILIGSVCLSVLFSFFPSLFLSLAIYLSLSRLILVSVSLPAYITIYALAPTNHPASPTGFNTPFDMTKPFVSLALVCLAERFCWYCCFISVVEHSAICSLVRRACGGRGK